ncbi:hypothetical protein F5Y18DRAFT_431374 [Xylariaceae sp. FL1019]|nr:hypothetical protein F5Y18DRAFT_431374 [Xylariaceae sp. FL1019]
MAMTRSASLVLTIVTKVDKPFLLYPHRPKREIIATHHLLHTGGWCCATGFACVSVGASGISCSSTSTSFEPEQSTTSLSLLATTNPDMSSSNIPTAVLVSYVTVQQPPQTGQVDNPDDKGFTPANIGAIVGGVVTLVAFLGIVDYLIRGRLGQAKQSHRKSSLENSNEDMSIQERPAIPELEAREEGSEVWGSATQGIPSRVVHELAGSYEAHGISEMEGIQGKGKAFCTSIESVRNLEAWGFSARDQDHWSTPSSNTSRHCLVNTSGHSSVRRDSGQRGVDILYSQILGCRERRPQRPFDSIYYSTPVFEVDADQSDGRYAAQGASGVRRNGTGKQAHGNQEKKVQGFKKRSLVLDPPSYTG